eukprot:maker-scaffold98_size375582-snap-gene-2.41 protein:Tk06138 transcript:maker-scaffold98_size375582-snap-gene-2.41-mRNA-1 annotation:"chymotrypsin-like elastase family member 2a"
MEVMRGESIKLNIPKDKFSCEDFISLQLKHADPKYEGPIEACNKHQEGISKHAFKILNAGKLTINTRADIATIRGSFDTFLALQFTCCGSEVHNGGGSADARNWILKIAGTMSGREFETEICLQTFSTLRSPTRLKRKLNLKIEKEEDADSSTKSKREKQMDLIVEPLKKMDPSVFDEYFKKFMRILHANSGPLICVQD